MKHFTITFILLFVLLTSAQEPILEEFNTLTELTQNWWVSGWGQAAKQYSADMVAVENGILKLTMDPAWVNEAEHSGEAWYTPGLIGAPRPICGEVTYTAQKFLYGSFRASIKTTDKSGGVVGWFVYKDGIPGDGNLHEIDVEYLTEDLSQIHFTLHHDTYSVEHKIVPITFDPSVDFHEYRFDWYADSVVYFIDSIRITSLTTLVPDDSTAIMLNWWSNNEPYWGGPMPDTTTHMWIDYMHYYPLDDITGISLAQETPAKVLALSIMQTGQSLALQFPKNDTYKISIYSAQGRLLQEKSVRGVSSTITTSDLGNQMLLLKVSNSMGVLYKTMIPKL